jgi:hypothetical protein
MSDLGPLGCCGFYLLALDLGHSLQHPHLDLTHQRFGDVDPELCQRSDHLFGLACIPRRARASWIALG